MNFIEKNNGYFGSKDYPMMWFVNDHKYQSSPLEQALQPWNITKVYFSEPEDPIIPSEFNHWLSKVDQLPQANRSDCGMRTFGPNQRIPGRLFITDLIIIRIQTQ